MAVSIFFCDRFCGLVVNFAAILHLAQIFEEFDVFAGVKIPYFNALDRKKLSYIVYE